MSLFSIGVDLGGTNLRIAAMEADGNLLEKITLGTQVSKGRDFVIGEMCGAIESLMTRYAEGRTLCGVGIGIPGIIDKRTGLLRESPNLPGWHDTPVRDDISKRLGTDVVLENDANVAAFGENWLGAGRGYDEMCMITLGTGVGGGLVLRGGVWLGMNGMAGEIGHVTVDPTAIRAAAAISDAWSSIRRPPASCEWRGTRLRRATHRSWRSWQMGRMSSSTLARCSTWHYREMRRRSVFTIAWDGPWEC